MARIVIEVDTRNSVKAINAIENALDRADVDLIKLERDAKRTGNTLRSTFSASLGASIGGIFAGLATGAAVRGIIQVADEMSGIRARVRSVTDSIEEYNLAQDEIFAISQRTGSQLASNANSFAKLNGAVKEVGGSTDQTLQVVETLNKAFVINGSTGEEISSVMLQFAQAMGSGRLQGEELRAVLEGNAFFARELAKALGTNIAGLREMAANGELTTTVLLEAFPKIAQTVDESFGNIPLTVGRAFTEVENAIKRSIGLIDESSNSSNELAKSIQQIARTIENNQEAITNFAQGIAVVADIGIRAFSALSNFIGVAIGDILTLASLVSDAFRKAWAIISITAKNAFAAIAEDASSTITGAINLLNKIPGIDIDLDPEIVQRLNEISDGSQNLQKELDSISEAGQNLRRIYAEQTQEYLKGFQAAIKGSQDTAKEQKKVEEAQKEVAKAVSETVVVFDEATGSYQTLSSAAVASLAEQTNSWDQLGKSGVESVNTIQNALTELTSRRYSVTIDVNENRVNPGSGAVTAGPSTGSSFTGARSEGSQNVNLNMTLPGSSAPVTVPTTRTGASTIINEVNRLNRRQS